MSSVEPAVRPLGATGPRSKVDAWCGAGLKREGSVYLIGAAGGHGDYAGNEVDALALNTATPKWVELRGPSPNSQIINNTQFYLDSQPSSTHTYSATQFINATNRLMVFPSQGVFGAFPAAPEGFAYSGDSRSYSFNMGAGSWDNPDAVARYPGGGDWISCLCVKHPWTDDVYYARNAAKGFWRWTRATNTWDLMSNENRGTWYSGQAIDPVRNRMLIVGGYSGAAPEVRDLTGRVEAASFGGLGASAITLSGYPGVMYDEALDRFLVLHNNGSTVRLLVVNPSTWAIEAANTTGTAPSARVNGIHNSAQYVPELRGFVFVNNYNGNAYFMRTSA